MAHIHAPRAAAPHDERADVVLLVHDDERAVPGLLEQGVHVGDAALDPAAGRDLAGGIESYRPVERLADVYAEVGIVRREVVFPAGCHGGSLLLGRLATVSAGATPTLLGRRGSGAQAARQVPISRSRADHQPPAASPPGPSERQGRRAVRGRSASSPGQGPHTRLGNSRTKRDRC